MSVFQSISNTEHLDEKLFQELISKGWDEETLNLMKDMGHSYSRERDSFIGDPVAFGSWADNTQRPKKTNSSIRIPDSRLKKLAKLIESHFDVEDSEMVEILEDNGFGIEDLEQLNDIDRIHQLINSGCAVCGKNERQGKVGRNEKCPCGSGSKFKKCCIKKNRF